MSESAARKIIHIDMDAFYAAVEVRERPDLKGRPLVVGGMPGNRAVVATASYEARRFGIHSAMSVNRAYQLCPKAIFLEPNFDLYKSTSRDVMGVFYEFTDLVEPLSLDEAYLDVTKDIRGIGSATETARIIRQKVFERTGLTCSAGVAPNKFLAKVASELNKPDGLAVIRPSQVDEVLKTLPVRSIPGVGKVTEERLLEKGICLVGDLRRFSKEEIESWFGKHGSWLYSAALGIDEREVDPHWERKSVGAEETFGKDIFSRQELEIELKNIADKAWRRLEALGQFARTLTVKVKFCDFRTVTRSHTAIDGIWNQSDALASACLLLAEFMGKEPIRLLGLTYSGLQQEPQARIKKARSSGAVQLEFSYCYR